MNKKTAIALALFGIVFGALIMWGFEWVFSLRLENPMNPSFAMYCSAVLWLTRALFVLSNFLIIKDLITALRAEPNLKEIKESLNKITDIKRDSPSMTFPVITSAFDPQTGREVSDK